MAFSVPAFAKVSLCDGNFTANPFPARSVTPAEVAQAEFWLRSNGADEGFPQALKQNPQFLSFLKLNGKDSTAMDKEEFQDWAARYALSKWTSWDKTNSEQRNLALTLEMMKISPKNPENKVISLIVGKPADDSPPAFDLKAASRANKERMLAQLRAAYEIPADAANDQSLKDVAESLSQQIRFSYVRPIHLTQFVPAPEDFAGPILSPRDLAPYGLDYASGLYSNMVGHSPSAEFMVTALSETRDTPDSIGNLLRRESAVLNPSAAKRMGFAIPRFASVTAMFDFFEFWDPKACEETFRTNWKGLPKDVRTYDEFRAYLEAHADELNLQENAYARLAPMRTRLNQYVMTTADLEDFLGQAINLWVMHLGAHDPTGSLSQVRMDVDTVGKTLYVFRERVLPFLHMEDGLSLRVPVGVTSGDYALARVTGMVEAKKRTATAAADRAYARPKGIRNGQVDHDSKP